MQHLFKRKKGMAMDQGMLRDNALADKVVLVTGGGTGLGKSMAGYFAQLGALVVITSRKMDVLNQTAMQLSKAGSGTVRAIECDISNPDSVDKMIQQVITDHGKIHAVVNNAAANFISPTERLSPRAFKLIVDIVLTGTANVTLAVGKQWIDDGIPGVFLNILATYAFTGSGYVVPSAAAKAGVLAITRSLAVEWAKYGIRSNAIAPGPFPTEGAWSRLLPGDLAERFNPAKRVPLGRVGNHQELANLAAYLVSDYASFINGEVITIDGGEWLQGAGEFNGFDAVPQPLWDQLENQRKK